MVGILWTDCPGCYREVGLSPFTVWILMQTN